MGFSLQDLNLTELLSAAGTVAAIVLAWDFLVSKGVLGALMTWEYLFPRRRLRTSRLRRWPNNIGIMIVDRLFYRFIVPFGSASTALIAQHYDIGLFNHVELPLWVLIPVCFIILDFSNYVQHLLAHFVPWIWRLHRVHHSDTDFDVTTAIRTHPLESFMIALFYSGVAFAGGMPPEIVLAFHAYAGVVGKFCHSNIAMPKTADAILRLFMITPDMHRVHHSAWQRETDRNFGAVFPFWDRLFGTYKAQPVAGHEEMIIGLEEFRMPEDQRVDKLLLMPFKANRFADWSENVVAAANAAQKTAATPQG